MKNVWIVDFAVKFANISIQFLNVKKLKSPMAAIFWMRQY